MRESQEEVGRIVVPPERARASGYGASRQESRDHMNVRQQQSAAIELLRQSVQRVQKRIRRSERLTAADLPDGRAQRGGGASG
jgi:hypothetical protein